VRHGKTKLEVEQTFDDGSVISIEKSKTINSYHVNGQVLAKIGKDVPETVREILQTDELVLDKDLSCDLNFSGQFDSPFLLTDSSTLVTKVISSLSGIEIIYSALREGQSEAQKLKAQSQVLAGNVSILEKFDGLQEESIEVQRDLTVMQLRERDVVKLEEEIEWLARLLDRSNVLQSKTVDVVEEQKYLDDLLRIKKYGIDEVEVQISNIKELQRRASSVPQADLSEIDSLVDLRTKICGILEVVKQDEAVYNRLVLQREDWSGMCLALDSGALDLTALIKQEAELKASIKICDKCGRPL
jgi:hypothetical protein